ncbi:MAG: MaoC family dehydratase N-terminal domain-containing protein [Dehalococcoidia bacterium]|nr:MaoC family dehydratase N-terminal domain-containing protein [Dehalococcoidia bacterium]MCA9850225.1 MaoC family dehydratase N-terminal domain-containing protein [Dehalococcoidia bacterium]MCA9856300.1 MaoC family dehydratase N-terminal domain-containing protein [Dehalococcoidia bacterium]
MAESAAPSVVTDEMRAQLGVEGPETTLEVTSTGCRLFARAVGHTDAVFYDRDVARSRGYRDLLAPPGFLGTPVYRPGMRDDMERGPGLKLPYKRVLNGGTTYEYVEPVCAGDVLTSRSRICDYQEREGSIGPMLIVYRETTYRRAGGEVVARVRGNVIHY